MLRSTPFTPSRAMGVLMRVVSIEEHFTIPELAARISSTRILERGNPPPDRAPKLLGAIHAQLADLGDARIADMDAANITLQVLSWAGPGADLLDADEALGWTRECNDALAEAIAAQPSRFSGFAHLPMTMPEAAAEELDRCVRTLRFKGGMVNGTTGGRFLDHPSYEPLLDCAERLDVPLYIHPNIPPAAVREGYYADLPRDTGFLLSTYGFGWHAEVAVHVLRMVLSGTLDRHPGLKLVIGHMGEFLPMTLDRTTRMLGIELDGHLTRPIAQQLRDQVWVTTSGQFTLPPLRAAIDTFGIDRILFSVDYPYSTNAEGSALLQMLPFAPRDIAKIGHGNADLLLRLSAA